MKEPNALMKTEEQRNEGPGLREPVAGRGSLVEPAVGEVLACLRASHARVLGELEPLRGGSGEAGKVLVREAADELGAAVRLLEARLDQLERSAGEEGDAEGAAVRVAEALSVSGNALQKFGFRRIPRVGALFAGLALDYRLAVTRLLARLIPAEGGVVSLQAGVFHVRPCPGGRPVPGWRGGSDRPASRGALVPACP